MYKICVFGGTTEGRELVEFLNAQPCEVTACVATEYGQALLPEAERLTVSARRLPADEIKALLTDRHFDLVIDATHPYAASITKSIARACAETGVERWRLLRGASDAPEDAVFVESTEKAIEFLDQTEGNILLTTGSKELKAYSQIKDFAERVYARVLPLEDSLVLCREAGVKAAHILAMQGPFSEEMNTAMLRAIGAKWLVTKDGGAAGGFAERRQPPRRPACAFWSSDGPQRRTGSDFQRRSRDSVRGFRLGACRMFALWALGPAARRCRRARSVQRSSIRTA